MTIKKLISGFWMTLFAAYALAQSASAYETVPMVVAKGVNYSVLKTGALVILGEDVHVGGVLFQRGTPLRTIGYESSVSDIVEQYESNAPFTSANDITLLLGRESDEQPALGIQCRDSLRTSWGNRTRSFRGITCAVVFDGVYPAETVIYRP
jgi:hypothetical protein